MTQFSIYIQLTLLNPINKQKISNFSFSGNGSDDHQQFIVANSKE